MDKVDEFKEFIKDNPHLKTRVDNKETSWQALYENFDIFGKEHESFRKDYKKQESTKSKDTSEAEAAAAGTGLGTLLKAFEGVNLNKVSENLEGVKKILGVLGEFTKKEEPSTGRRVKDQPLRRYDD